MVGAVVPALFLRVSALPPSPREVGAFRSVERLREYTLHVGVMSRV